MATTMKVWPGSPSFMGENGLINTFNSINVTSLYVSLYSGMYGTKTVGQPD